MTIRPASPRAAAYHPNTTTTGELSWWPPFLMLCARTVLAIGSQAVLAWIFLLQGSKIPWAAAAPWWTVYGTLIDIGCLVGLMLLVRGQGSRVLDLVRIQRERLGPDFMMGIAYAAGMLVVGVVGGVVGSVLVYGASPAPSPIGPLPPWGILYSLLIWPLLWGAAEELTYLGYCLPRIEALTGRTSIAFVLVVLSWSVQHCALPFRMDGTSCFGGQPPRAQLRSWPR